MYNNISVAFALFDISKLYFVLWLYGWIYPSFEFLNLDFFCISEVLESFALDILKIRNVFYEFVENKHFVP